MKGTKHKPEQIIKKLREADAMLLRRSRLAKSARRSDQRADLSPVAAATTAG